ncbi:hypothetical protein Ctob_003727 [Chrysochromulina tobinii]|uniref:Uncharacterized protein n=1 Tax=Chrysochromulina tobinii TaxID=1460289 RepID=A0A0M0JAS4_9EUKA|nr:hypothetical protein Ctob_003727 [Chrysochromulina tobinii]|eukprot:KOO23671.1 hypothetical protein Ctob_003727 [Chrysochromulina sp. CCMP291]
MPITFAIHYKLAAMGASADDTKRDRALHPVYEAAGSAKFDGWLLHPPRDGEVDGGIAGVLPGTLAKICMAFVQCGDDIVNESVGDNGLILAVAWERILTTLAEVHGGDGSKAISLGCLYEDMDAKLSKATPVQLAQLTLYKHDLGSSISLASKPVAPVPSTDPAAAAANAAALLVHAQALGNWEGNEKHPFTWLRLLTFGDLRDNTTGRLGALGRLMCATPTWVSDTTRGEAIFRRTLTALAKAAIEGTDIQVGDADDVAGCVAEKLKLIDLPRAMESFGGATQEARSRALLKEIKAIVNPAARQELLRERFIEAIDRLAGVRALVGIRAGGGCDMGSSACFGLCAEVATRMGLCRSEDEFSWASLRALRDEIAHLDEMLSAEPWVHRTARDRADRVIDFHRTQAKRSSAASVLYSTPDRTATGRSPDTALTAAESRLRGTVPRHFQGDLSQATSNTQWLALKAAIIGRLALGGKGCHLDAMQIGASGVALDPATNMPKQRQWCPLMAMLAEGATRGVDAATLDPELQALTDAARDRWPELYGRTAGLQLALDKTTLPEELEGWCLDELAKAFASADWSAIDLGAAFEQTRARMRCEKFEAGPADKAYTNRRSIENALKVAEPMLMLRGFGGNGKGTLPFVLEELSAGRAT